MKWYFPSFYGDIQLVAVSEKVTRLRAFSLTPSEEEALARLRARALEEGIFRKAWATVEEFLPVTEASYRSKPEGVTVDLRAPLDEVRKVLNKHLKPGRELVHAVKYTDGVIEESAAPKDEAEAAPKDEPKPEKKDKPKKEKKEGVSVATPTVGCPMPAFDEVEIRANRVLEAFLSPDQIDDYHRHGLFVVVGADSGRRYMVGHRERPEVLRKMGGRQVYDLDRGQPLCVHDWTVPAPEEMLALKLMLTLPGREKYVTSLPEAFEG